MDAQQQDDAFARLQRVADGLPVVPPLGNQRVFERQPKLCPGQRHHLGRQQRLHHKGKHQPLARPRRGQGHKQRQHQTINQRQRCAAQAHFQRVLAGAPGIGGHQRGQHRLPRGAQQRQAHLQRQIDGGQQAEHRHKGEREPEQPTLLRGATRPQPT